MTDREWTKYVETIAKQPKLYKRDVDIAAYYLWCAPGAYDRLSETIYGKFIRECDNLIPDLSLRNQYRQEIARGTK